MKALASEMTANFSKRLAPLGITVRELTGDMQLTKSEILKTQMLVTVSSKAVFLSLAPVHIISLTTLTIYVTCTNRRQRNGTWSLGSQLEM